MSSRAALDLFARNQHGSIAVEFALLATFLIMLTASGIDLINVSAFNREIERSTKQVAAAIVACPNSSTPGYTSCTTDSINQYNARTSNALVRYPLMTVQILQINEISNQILVCSGNSTKLDADVQTRALAVLNDKDVAIVVVMSMVYIPYFPKITKLFFWGGVENNLLRGYTIAVQASNIKLCGN